MQLFKNPFYLYIISFGFALVVYQLDWSDIYPEISLGLTIFFILTFLISLFIGAVIDKYSRIKYLLINNDNNVSLVTIIIYFFLSLEFIYNKGIPFTLAIHSPLYDYREFGIPMLHPVLATFASFYTVYVFHLYLSIRKKSYLVTLIFLLTIPLLIYNRGMLLINLTSILFVYLMSRKRIRLRAIILISAAVLIILYFFGVLGNYRISKSPENDLFLEISGASEEFKKSSIPKEYMWTYIYFSSPLANLQSNINSNPPVNYRVKDFLILELLPDFISKRIAPFLDAKRPEPNNISDSLIVGTIFCNSYNLLGWPGLIFMFIFITASVIVYLILLKKSNRFYITGISILLTFMVYNTFDNMIYFSGISFQLVYPILWQVLQELGIGKTGRYNNVS